MENLSPVFVAVEDVDATDYSRYSTTDSGISLRLLLEMQESLVIGDSDEHTEDGHIIEDLYNLVSYIHFW